MTVKELRGRYVEVFGEATRTGNKDWLWKRIAWRIQALARATCRNVPANGPSSSPATPTCGPRPQAAVVDVGQEQPGAARAGLWPVEARL